MPSVAIITDERRTTPRFPAQHSVEFDGGVGTTTNLSVTGLEFAAAQCEYLPGEALRVAVILDAEESADIVRLQCIGRIVRRTSRETGVTVAATIESFWLERWSNEDGGSLLSM